MIRTRRFARFLTTLVALGLLLGAVSPALPAAAASPTPTKPPATRVAAPATPTPKAVPRSTGPRLAPTATPTSTTADVASMRTRTSDTFLTAQGYTTQISPGSINYPDANGAWQPIVNTLVASTTAGYADQNQANRYTALFPSSLSTNPIKITKGNAFVSYALTGAAGTLATNGSVATYASALPGVTVTDTALNDAVDETLTLASATAGHSFSYTLRTSAGLTAQANSTGGVNFVDSASVVQLSFAAPSVADASGATPTSAPTLTFTKVGSVQTVTVAVDATWLADTARVWPVTIDPLTVIDPALNCNISDGSNANSTYCTPTNLYVGKDSAHTWRSLLSFNLSPIPGNATVLDAQLQLYLVATTGSGNTNVSVMRLTQGWTSGVTWNDTNGTSAWTNPGGTFNTTPLDTTTLSAVNQTYAWGLAPTVQGWLNGTVANQGILLKTAETSQDKWAFTPAGGTNPPVLRVVWENWLGTPAFFTDYTHGLTDRSSLAVNVVNGNLILHATDLSVAGTGMPLVVDRTFNNLADHTYDIGQHWVVSLGRGPHLNTSGLNGVASYGPDGFASLFTNNGTGGFIHPAGVEATLVKNVGGTYTLTDNPTGRVLTFDAPNGSGWSKLSTIADKNGNTISLTYNTGGYVTALHDTQNRQVTYGYNASNEITSITDWTSREVQYGYDTYGNLTDYWDALNNHTVYSYSSTNHTDLTKITDALGNQTTFTYNNHHVLSVTYVTDTVHGTGPTVNFTYNPSATTLTDPDTNQTTYDFDVLGRVTDVIDAASNTQQTSYNADNQVLTTTDAYSHVTTNTYSTDGNDNLDQIQLPAEGTLAGALVTWTYTDTSHPFYPTTHVDAQGNTTTYTYDTPGNLHTITDQLTTQNSSTINHNTNGTVSSVVDFDGNTTSYTYDTNGNLTKMTPATITSGTGTQLGATTITPDTLSRPGTIQDGKLQNTVYTYDALDRTHVTTYADTTTITNNFDPDGNVTSLVDGTGTTSFTYDDLNRPVAKVLPGLTTPCSVTVNGTATSGTICYAYDAASNLTSYSDATAAITCNTLTVTICYSFNSLNELSTLVDPTNKTTSYTYDNNHQRKTTTYPGSTVQTATYDNAQRLTGMSAVNGTNTLTNYTYSYTNPTTSKDTLLPYTISQSDSYLHNATAVKSYDVLNHLLEWNVTPGTGSLIGSHDYKYAYDGNGNRTTINITTTNVTSLAYNADNEWYQSTNTGQTQTNTVNWDAAGNMLGNNDFGGGPHPLTVTYNAKEQTATQTDTAQVVWTRTFTGRGQAEQVQETSTSGTHNYTYSQLGLTTIVGSTATYVRDPSGGLVSQQGTSGGPFYYLSDGQGSVGGLVDASGNQAASYFYCPTGNQADGPWGTAAAGNPFQIYGVLYEPGFQSYWIDGVQYDANSGNPFQLIGTQPDLILMDFCNDCEGIIGEIGAGGPGFGGGEGGGGDNSVADEPTLGGAPSSGMTIVITANGYSVPVPEGWVSSVANNGAGIVYQEPGASGNANSIRIMDPSSQYPNGYVRYYNAYGQPINPATGNPGSQAQTHIPLDYTGPLQGYPESP